MTGNAGEFGAGDFGLKFVKGCEGGDEGGESGSGGSETCGGGEVVLGAHVDGPFGELQNEEGSREDMISSSVLARCTLC